MPLLTPGVLSPSQFLDPEVLLDPSDLEIEILTDTVRPSSLRAGRSVRDLEVNRR